MQEFFTFLLQFAAVTVYLIFIIFFTFGLIQGYLKEKKEAFGPAHQEVLDTIRKLEEKFDAAFTADD